MSTFDPNNPDHQQLMADAVTEGLSPQDQATLDQMLRNSDEARDELERFELSAAAIDLALSAQHLRHPLPAALRDQLIASATPYVTKPLAEGEIGEPHHHSLAEYRAASAAAAPTSPAAGFSWAGPQALGWYAAIAALIALGFVIALPKPGKQIDEAALEAAIRQEVEQSLESRKLGDAVFDSLRRSIQEQLKPKPIEEQYAQLLAKPGVVTAPWTYNADGGDVRFTNCSGQIVFDPETQTGYMKLTGVPVNDPDYEQYQLWIVDATRTDETTPRIDGGVFNVDSTGEVIIPCRSKIVANEPIVFALTIEKPGGVVVSQGPLQAVAMVQ